LSRSAAAALIRRMTSGSMDVRTVSLGPPEAFRHAWPIFDPPLLCPHVVRRLESHERPIKLVRPNHFDAKICTSVLWATGAERFNRRQEVGKGPVLPMFGKLERAKGIEPSYAAWETVREPARPCCLNRKSKAAFTLPPRN
jgi:hypothetical protein